MTALPSTCITSAGSLAPHLAQRSGFLNCPVVVFTLCLIILISHEDKNIPQMRNLNYGKRQKGLLHSSPKNNGKNNQEK